MLKNVIYFFIVLFLASCGTKFSIQKRKYHKGYYLAVSHIKPLLNGANPTKGIHQNTTNDKKSKLAAEKFTNNSEGLKKDNLQSEPNQTNEDWFFSSNKKPAFKIESKNNKTIFRETPELNQKKNTSNAIVGQNHHRKSPSLLETLGGFVFGFAVLALLIWIINKFNLKWLILIAYVVLLIFVFFFMI